MSDGSLSQSEIDALLAGTEELMGNAPAAAATEAAGGVDSLSDSEKSSLLDVLRAAIDAAASSLGTVISTKVGVGMMDVEVMHAEEIKASLGGQLVQVNMSMQEGLSGENVFVISASGALQLFNLATGQGGQDVTDMVLNTTSQTMEQMYAAAASSLSARLNKTVKFSEARAQLAHANTELTLPTSTALAKLTYNLKIEGKEAIAITHVMPLKLARDIVNFSMGIGADMSFRAEMDLGGAMDGRSSQDAMIAPGQKGAAPVEYPQLNPGMGHHGQTANNISMLMDVQMQLSVELGRASKKISEILSFGEGSIIELDKLAGEPVDVLVNNKKIARGEVVVIDENFGVRVTEIVSPSSRIDM